jgi:hypothetical protein
MRLSQLQKLHPSTIDMCAIMVFVPRFAKKEKKLRLFFNTIAQFTNARCSHSGFYQ